MHIPCHLLFVLVKETRLVNCCSFYLYKIKMSNICNINSVCMWLIQYSTFYLVLFAIKHENNFSKGIWQSVRHKLIGALTLDMCQTSEILYDYNLYLTTYYIHVDLSQLCSVLQCSMTSYNVHSIITSHNVL